MLLYLLLVRDPDASYGTLPIFSLVRNSDLAGITSTIIQLERQFNKHFRYPYVFLNDIPFEQTFKESVVPILNVFDSGLFAKKILAVLQN